MTYAVRAIDLTIQLGTGSFGASGANTLTLSGLRVNATLSFVLPPGATSAVVQAYGLAAQPDQPTDPRRFAVHRPV